MSKVPKMISPEQRLSQAYNLHQAGDLAAADQEYQILRDLIPKNATIWLLSAALEEQQHHYAPALAYINQALRLPESQKNADVLQAKGEILRQMDQASDACRWFEKALKVTPDHLNARINYILALISCSAKDKNALKKAEFQLKKSYKIAPDHPLLFNAEGLILLEKKQPKHARIYFEKAMKLISDNPDFEGNYIITLLMLEEYQLAQSFIDKNLLKEPQNLKFKYHKSVCLEKTGEIQAAINALSDVTYDSFIQFSSLQSLFLQHLKHLNMHDKGIALLEEMQLHDTLETDLLHWLISFYSGTKKYQKGLKVARDLIAANPTPQDLRLCMDLFIQTCQYQDQQYVISRLNKPYCASFLHELTFIDRPDQAKEILDIFYQKQTVPKNSITSRQPAPHITSHTRPLKIAFLSSDIRTHSVGKFVLPFLRNYDPEALEITILANHHHFDDRMALEADDLTYQTHYISTLTTQEIFDKVAQNQPEIVIELNGHTALSRLDLISKRLAPTQIAWLGFPFSTATPNMDYFLVDSCLHPEDPQQFSEKLLVIEGPWISVNYDSLPEISPLPYDHAKRLTFGSMTNLYKITESSLDLWSLVLKNVPNSSFLLVYPLGESLKIIDSLKQQFAQRNIDPNRIVFLDNRTAKISHYDCYAHIDIALDTLPLTGGTTTIDAIGMGVPVITLQGPCLHQRLSHSILSYAQLGHFSAKTKEEFVRLATDLAADPQALGHLRATMRDRLQSSELTNASLFSKRLTETLLSL